MMKKFAKYDRDYFFVASCRLQIITMVNILGRQVRNAVSLTWNVHVDPDGALSNPSHSRIVNESLVHGICANSKEPGTKGAITTTIKHAMKHTIKLKTSRAKLAQLLQPSLSFCFKF